MNKNIRGCLVGVIVFILIIISAIFFIINGMNKSFQVDKNKVDKSWEKYTKILYYRNNTLKNLSNKKNVLPLIFKTEKILEAKSSKKELITNEYILNDTLRKYKYVNSFDEKLNNSLTNYNTNVKEFNGKYSRFPYNYLRIKKSIPLYDYFEIEYGSDNNEIIKKNQKIDNWIENGGELDIK